MSIYIKLILILIIICGSVDGSVFAAGQLRKLKGIADSMGSMDKVLDTETRNYNKCKEFITGNKIVAGLLKEDVKRYCGDPVARVDDGKRWVYKPSDSSFFEGEKIYLFFDENGILQDWQQIYQE